MNPNPLDEWFAHADDILTDWDGGRDSMHAMPALDLDTYLDAADMTTLQFTVPARGESVIGSIRWSWRE